MVHALPLGLRVVPIRVLGTHADAPGIPSFVKAGGVIRDAGSHAELRDATDLVARSAQEMGLDRFQPFLRRADEHLARTGGLLALVRDVPPPAAPPVARPPAMGPVAPRLPPPGQLMLLLRAVLRGALLGATAELLNAYTPSEQERQIRDVMERFNLDPSKPADAAAAVAFRWAQNRGPWLFDTPQIGPEMQAMAERVMRAVQANPALLDGALAGDAGALATIQAAVRRTTPPEPGRIYEGRTDEERALIAQLESEGKSGAEIQAALDYLRASRRTPTAEERRNTSGVVVVSTPLPRIDGPWLMSNVENKSEALIPAQVAKKLEGRSFETFKKFREAFWIAVAGTPELAKQFSPQNVARMRNGNAPFTPKAERTSRGRVWQLNHDPALSQGDPVYDLSHMTVVTPKQHDRLHAGDR